MVCKPKQRHYLALSLWCKSVPQTSDQTARSVTWNAVTPTS
ncbi:hypothetical protein CFBP1573P_02535 [Pseudomonas syringae pv. persicae]|uniref:Uncharacterized protein n=1 Tax=Pseudomonas syringae pv. persicae TaxID=237306 RepID=A0AB38EEQ8_9PSED|nr:hypothetical protein NCPPB2254_02349 [Pseudomonas syringae pv. persicae]SOQ09499.1 hypothetical protein CFBP1573P_02535 [Pseudomonas syringae pv. persicae]